MTRGRSGLGLANLGKDPGPVAKKTGCAVRGCRTKRVPIVVGEDERYCEKHGTAKADDAFRRFIWQRDPACVACGRSDRGVQCAHIETRGARYIRWDAENAVGLDAACHYAYTKRPAAWHAFVEKTYPGRLQRLLRRENYGQATGGSVDVAEIIRTYRAGVPWSWPDPPDV